MKILFSKSKSFINGCLLPSVPKRTNHTAKQTLFTALLFLLCFCSLNSVSGQSFSRNTTPVNYATPSTGTPTAEFSPCGGTPTTLTQSTSQSIVVSNSPSCNTGVSHNDNSYWRAFSLTNAFDVSSVEIGVEIADAGGAATSQPVTVNIYNNTGGVFPAGTRTLVGTANYSMADQSLTIASIPVTASLPANSQMVVEIFTPDGQAAGHLFFIGSNAAGQAAPSYISSATCGVTTPSTFARIGSPNTHIVMNVVGCDIPCPTPAPIVSNVERCHNAPPSVLTATGTNLKWYTTATGGTGSTTAPTPSTATVGTVSYWVTQTAGGCESARAKIDVTVNPLPTITVGTLPIVAAGATSFSLPYTATTNTPTTYSISGTGITTAINAALGSSPITVSLSAAASLNIDFALTVKNANGCVSTNNTGTVLVTTPVAAGTTTVNFNGTAPIAPTTTTAGVGGRGSIATYTVPAGVTALKIDAKGAKGGKTPDFNGGAGGRVQATYTVTPGDVLYIMVGGKGGDGAADNNVDHRSAAGGGGGTFVFKGSISAANLLVAAGGGGGAGDQGNGGISNSTPGTGGGFIAAGGGSLSTDGGTSTIENDCGKGGKAAINTGNGGENACFKPETNGGGYGGGGAGNYSISNNAAGGGGGGGYVGGNSGGVAGGNGGSSFTAAGATNVTTNNHSDDNGSVSFCVVATVAYTGSPYCKSLTTSGTPTTTGYTGGTFSASPAGLTINATTGVINPSTSTAGTYTVTYNTPNLVGCTAATASVTISALPTVSITGLNAAYCQNEIGVVLSGIPAGAGGSFKIDGVASTVFSPNQWTVGNHAVVFTY